MRLSETRRVAESQNDVLGHRSRSSIERLVAAHGIGSSHGSGSAAREPPRGRAESSVGMQAKDLGLGIGLRRSPATAREPLALQGPGPGRGVVRSVTPVLTKAARQASHVEA